MAPPFDPASVTPLYEQAADYVAGQIERGELRPGQKLPAERDLADEWGIAYQTVRRAMRELRDRGLVVSRVGKGTFVRSKLRVIRDTNGSRFQHAGHPPPSTCVLPGKGGSGTERRAPKALLAGVTFAASLAVRGGTT